MCYNVVNNYKEVLSWLIRFLKIAFPVALAPMSAPLALSLRAIPSMLLTLTLASTAVLVLVLALLVLPRLNNFRRFERPSLPGGLLFCPEKAGEESGVNAKNIKINVYR